MAKVKTGPKVKRKGGGVPAKAKKVEGLSEQLQAASAVIVTDYRGLTVSEIQDLRRRLRPRGVEYHVVKNSLFARAADGVGRGALRSFLVGPVAVAVGSIDEVDLAKGLVEEARAFKALRITGGLIAGQALGGDEIVTLAKLPPRSQLQAAIVGSIQAPLGQLTSLFQAPAASLVRVLDARGRAA